MSDQEKIMWSFPSTFHVSLFLVLVFPEIHIILQNFDGWLFVSFSISKGKKKTNLKIPDIFFKVKYK